MTCTVKEEMLTSKRLIVAQVKEVKKNTPLAPALTLYLPILKKEALEYAIYVAAQMGATTIIPIITEKSQRKIPDHTRLEKIMIAACEQAKNFALPELKEPLTLSAALEGPTLHEGTKGSTIKIYFDDEGSPLGELLKENKTKTLAVTLGPEGGFTKQETDLLQQASFTSYKLTPTILRSREAVTAGLGALRSLIG